MVKTFRGQNIYLNDLVEEFALVGGMAWCFA
jgi:hypothetical protein